ncbi:MAG: DUF5677 domain-containing protein [Actinomycetota bacterium]
MRNLFDPKRDEEILEITHEGALRLIEQGHPEADVLRWIEETVPDAITEAAKPIAEELKRTSYRMVLEHQAIRRGLEARLAHRWLDGLVLYESVLVASQEMGSEFAQHHRDGAAEEHDLVFEALVRLQARACLTASEILSLLRSGYPFGAHARWRTLHELAVVAGLIARSGREIAERYLLHQGIQEAKDAEDYQKYAERLGYEPFPADEMQAHRKLRAELIERFGRAFKNPYGWAVPLFEGNTDPKFRDLEKLAGLDHLRPHYGWASHRVHAGAKGAALNIVSRGPESAYLTGPTNAGLADPGHWGPDLSLAGDDRPDSVRSRIGRGVATRHGDGYRFSAACRRGRRRVLACAS